MSEEQNADIQQENTRVYGVPFTKDDPRINRNGRPKKKTFRDYFNEEEEYLLVEKIKAEIQGETRPDIIKMVVEQIFGKPKQPLVGGEEDDPKIQIELSEKIAKKNQLYDSDTFTE